MPLGLFLALAGRLVAPAFRGGDAHVHDRTAVLHPPHLRVLAQIADQNDLVDRACHCSSPPIVWAAPYAAAAAGAPGEITCPRQYGDGIAAHVFSFCSNMSTASTQLPAPSPAL